MYRKVVCILLLLASVIGSNIAAKELPQWTTADYIHTSFVEIALNNEYSAKKSGVRKWTEPVRYFFVHRVADEKLHEKLSELHLQHLSDITGVEVQRVNRKQQANLLIVFSTESRLQKELLNEFHIKSKQQRTQLFRNSVCLAHFSINSDSSIRKAIVIIPVDRARERAKLISCIVEEITQVMGLPNDSDKVFPSIFNDKSIDELLSGLDYLLLKLLYEPRLKVGMTKSEINAILRKIISEYEHNGIISQAEEQVMKGGLYSLLY